MYVFRICCLQLALIICAYAELTNATTARSLQEVNATLDIGARWAIQVVRGEPEKALNQAIETEQLHPVDPEETHPTKFAFQLFVSDTLNLWIRPEKGALSLVAAFSVPEEFVHAVMNDPSRPPDESLVPHSAISRFLSDLSGVYGWSVATIDIFPMDFHRMPQMLIDPNHNFLIHEFPWNPNMTAAQLRDAMLILYTTINQSNCATALSGQRALLN
jgi:hypothetical protein